MINGLLPGGGGGDTTPVPEWKKKLFSSLYNRTTESTGHTNYAPTQQQLQQQRKEEKTKPKVVYKDRKNDDALRELVAKNKSPVNEGGYDTLDHLAYAQLLREAGSPDVKLGEGEMGKMPWGEGRPYFKDNTIYGYKASNIIPEAAHAFQRNVQSSPAGYWLRSMKDRLLTGGSFSHNEALYNKQGTIENEAHTGAYNGDAIEDRLKNRYYHILDSISNTPGFRTGDQFADLKPVGLLSALLPAKKKEK